MILLDTNVLSELIKPVPAPQVVAWVDGQEVTELVITSITAAELFAGAALLANGRRKEALRSQIQRLVDDVFAGYVLPFDAAAARHYGDIVAACRRKGHPITAMDAQIAAICRLHAATLATRNGGDFRSTGLPIVNPWEQG